MTELIKKIINNIGTLMLINLLFFILLSAIALAIDTTPPVINSIKTFLNMHLFCF